MRQIRSEFRKFFSTRLWWILLLAGFVYLAFIALTIVASYHFLPEEVEAGGMAALEGSQLARLVYGLGSTLGYVFPALIGTMAVATEYRHQTITPTFLAGPHRVGVLLAKAIAALPLGLLYGLAIVGGCLAGGAGFLAIVGGETGLSERATWEGLGRAVLALTLWAVVGVGLGVLLKNQVAAIVVLLAFTQFVEPTLRIIPMLTGQELPFLNYLPGAASDAIAGDSLFALMQGASSDSLGLLPGVGVLLGYGLFFALIGYFVNWRRDVS